MIFTGIAFFLFYVFTGFSTREIDDYESTVFLVKNIKVNERDISSGRGKFKVFEYAIYSGSEKYYLLYNSWRDLNAYSPKIGINDFVDIHYVDDKPDFGGKRIVDLKSDGTVKYSFDYFMAAQRNREWIIGFLGVLFILLGVINKYFRRS